MYLFIARVVCLTISVMFWGDLALTVWTWHKRVAFFRATAHIHARFTAMPSRYPSCRSRKLISIYWYILIFFIFILDTCFILYDMKLLDIVYFVRSHAVPIYCNFCRVHCWLQGKLPSSKRSIQSMGWLWPERHWPGKRPRSVRRVHNNEEFDHQDAPEGLNILN